MGRLSSYCLHELEDLVGGLSYESSIVLLLALSRGCVAKVSV